MMDYIKLILIIIAMVVILGWLSMVRAKSIQDLADRKNQKNNRKDKNT